MQKISVLQKADILKNAKIENFIKETQTLISFVIEKPFAYLIGCKEVEITEKQLQLLDTCLLRRSGGEPMQYILGYCWFWKHKFKVNKDVLIPRPESEHMIEEVLRLYSKDFQGKIIDCCTGSGCIGISLSLEFENSLVTLSDISNYALNIAYENSINLNCKNVNVVNADLLKGFKENSIDLIVANPPYVGFNDKGILQKEVVNFEPTVALFAGYDGLGLIKPLIEMGQYVLKKGGYLIFEFGINQNYEIMRFAKEKFLGIYTNCYTVKDLAGIERLGVFRRA